MSEVERFSNDLKSNPDLLAKIRPEAIGLAVVVSFAASRGYHFSLDEAKQFITARSPRSPNGKKIDATGRDVMDGQYQL